MATRQRPAGPGSQVSQDQAAQAAAVANRALSDLWLAHRAAVEALTSIDHPVERAKAAMLIRRTTTTTFAVLTDDLFETAVVEAYTAGKKAHGWYGYGALAEQLGLSRARVQQIVNGNWRRAAPRNT